MSRITHAIKIASIASVAAYSSGATQTVYQNGYLKSINLGDFNSANAFVLTNAAITISSTAVAARRAGVKVTFVTTTPSTLAAAAHAAATSLTPAAFVSGVTAANAAHVATGGTAVSVPTAADITVETPTLAVVTAPTPPPSHSSSDDGLSTGAIIGISVAGGVVLLAILGGFVYMMMSSGASAPADKQEQDLESEPAAAAPMGDDLTGRSCC